MRRFGPLHYATIRPAQEIDLGEWVSLPAGYSPTNPGMTAVGDRLLVSVRGVNYRLGSDTSLTMLTAPGSALHSINRFLLVDRNGHRQRALPELAAGFDDIEDVRLFSHDGKTAAIGSAPAARGRRLALFTLADRLDGVTRRQDIPSPFGLPVEKNWCPFVHRGDLHFLYSFDPLIILRHEPAGGRLALVTPAKAPPDFYLLSGSTPGLPVEGGYVFIAHRRSVRLPNLDRIYVHHVIFLDDDLSRVRVGPAFVIGHREIQFVAGMAVSGRTLFVSYGRADRMARLALLDVDQLPAPCPIASPIASSTTPVDEAVQ